MNEIQTQFVTGQTLYSIIRNSASNIFNGNATFVAFNPPDWPTYAASCPLTEQDDSGFYQANFPTIIVAPDTYTIEIFAQYGNATPNDNYVGGGQLMWNSGAGGNLSGSNLTSLELVKTLLNISGSTYDSILLNYITVASTAVQNWTHQNLIYQTYNENYDGPWSRTLL